MSTPKVKKFSRAKNINLDKAEAFISGAESKKKTGEGAMQETSQETNATTSEKARQPENLKSVQKTESQKDNVPAEDEVRSEQFPWETANEKVLKGVNLRLTEVQWAKLRFIVDNSQYSIQKYIMTILEPAMDKSIEKIRTAPKII